VTAFKDFFREVFTSFENGQASFNKFDSKQIRKQLFKFSYAQNKGNSNFELNDKADAFETLDLMLSMLHSWQAALTTDTYVKTWQQLQAIACKTQSCFVHENFYLPRAN